MFVFKPVCGVEGVAGEEGRQEGGQAHQGKGPSKHTLEKHKKI